MAVKGSSTVQNYIKYAFGKHYNNNCTHHSYNLHCSYNKPLPATATPVMAYYRHLEVGHTTTTTAMAILGYIQRP